MDRTAYLVVFIRDERVVTAGIFSEPGQSLTMDGGSGTAATVCEATADTYQEACDAVVEMCRTWHHLQWLLPHVEHQHKRTVDGEEKAGSDGK